MENENLENLPELEEEVVTENFDDWDDVDEEVSSENNELPKEEVSEEGIDTPLEEKPENGEGDEGKLIELIKAKAKYNKEPVDINSVDEIVENFQKGLNYDKLTEKVNSYENGKLMNWVKEKAENLGVTVDEYIDKALEFDKNQKEQQEKEELAQMIENGVPEKVAQEVIATRALRHQLQKEKNELQKEKETKEETVKKEKELEDFVKEYPNLKADEIPKEVFLNAEKDKVPLKYAYSDYKRKELEKAVEIQKQNNNNLKSSLKGLDGKDNIENTKKDAFLDGFEEELY